MKILTGFAKFVLFAWCFASIALNPTAVAAEPVTTNQLLSAWSFQLPDGNPAWLRVHQGEDGQTLSADLLWSVGSARPTSEVTLNEGRLSFKRKVRWQPGGAGTFKLISEPFVAELDPNDSDQLQLTFSQVNLVDGKPVPNSQQTLSLSGKRIPDLPAQPDLSKIRFGAPIELFNGKDLSGWKLSRDNKLNGWRAENGLLINETPKTDFGAYGQYGNLITEDHFSDFELTIEYNVPAGGNSGIYLRGMYEAQVVDKNSKMQGIAGPGAIFGRILPSQNAAQPGGHWNRYVLTLVDRHITVELNGHKVIDNEPLIGCTGGGISSDDTAPGPIFLQGDHTSVRYRNIVLRPVVSKAVTAKNKRPNVLVIYGDDQGSIDMSCFGVKDLKTPHMDRLARQGLKLTQMYAPAPVCSASRVGLLTGRFPARAGQPGNGPLAAEEITLAEAFAAGGYSTGHVGKWHLGKTPESIPSGQGFANWFGHLEGCIDNYSHFFYWNGPNRHDLWDNGVEIHRGGQYFPDQMVDRCKQFMDEQGERPWMLYWAFNAPHYPYQGSAQWLEHYQDLPTPRREYCAFVSTMDQHIGEVLDHLDKTGQADNTIVIYQPDHGHSTEVRAFGGGGNAGPYRGAKFSLFEGGIRVPSVVRYPGQLPAGQVRDQFLTGCDWLPTLCDWCDVPLPKTTLDGISARQILEKNAESSRQQFYWQMGAGKSPQWAIRRGKWKLIGNPRDTTLPQTQQVNGGKLKDSVFLVDLGTDPSETKNVAIEYPEVVKELTEAKDKLVEQW